MPMLGEPDQALADKTTAWLTWMATHLKLGDKAGDEVYFLPNRLQARILGHMFSQWRRGYPVRLIILKPRQIGTSTVVQALFYTICHHTRTMKAFVVAHSKAGSDLVFQKAKFFNNHNPERRKMAYDNRGELRWAAPHDASFSVECAMDYVGTAGTFQLLHVSELAKWPRQSVSMNSLLQTVPDPTKTYKTAVVIESTANGEGDHFHKTWRDAKAHREKYPEDYNCYIPVFFSWLEFPEEYSMPIPKWYRFGSYNDEEKELMAAPYNATKKQLYWRRWCIQFKCGDSVEMFHQEYPKCVAGSTRVSTPCGIIPIADAVVGGQIRGQYPKGIKSTVEIMTSLGYTVMATGDHQLALADGTFREAEDCHGETVVLESPVFASEVYTAKWNDPPCVESTVRVDEDFGRFLGYFMGDGSVYDRTISVACCKDADVREDIKRLYQRFFRAPEERLTGNRLGNAFEIRCYTPKGRDILERLGCLHRNKSQNRVRRVHVPDCIWRSPKRVVREFLRGLFESDGFNGYNYPRVVFFAKGEQFIKDVQLLLLGFGITCRRVKATKKAGDGHLYEGNELQLRCNEAERFNQEIGFIGERKRSRYDNWLDKKNPGAPRLPLAMQDTVASISDAGEQEVFDITTESGTFSANGILAHNCDTEAFLASGDHAIPAYIRQYHAKTCVAPRYARLEWADKRQTVARMTECDFDPNGCWRIWEEPEQIHDYAVGGDVSEGLPIDPAYPHGKRDRSAITVLNRRYLRSAAIWVGTIDPDLLGEEMLKAGKYYNDAWMAPEVNNAGHSTLDRIRAAHYPRLYQRQRDPDEKDQTPRSLLGWRTTTTTRDGLIDQYIKWCRQNEDPEIGFRGAFTCLSSELADEEDTFVRKENRKREHRDGTWDDILFSAMIALEVHITCPRQVEYPQYLEPLGSVKLGPQFFGGYPKAKTFSMGSMTNIESS